MGGAHWERRLEALRSAIARGIGHGQRPKTHTPRGRSGANTDERHETHGEGEFYVRVGKRREGMGHGDNTA